MATMIKPLLPNQPNWKVLDNKRPTLDSKLKGQNNRNRTPLRKLGKLGKAWAQARRELKVEFARMGITRCEVCGVDNYLGFAHSKKRRNLKPEELKTVALLCNNCHDILEKCSEPVMTHLVQTIINYRTANYARWKGLLRSKEDLGIKEAVSESGNSPTQNTLET